jgi:hypothetical protein
MRRRKERKEKLAFSSFMFTYSTFPYYVGKRQYCECELYNSSLHNKIVHGKFTTFTKKRAFLRDRPGKFE